MGATKTAFSKWMHKQTGVYSDKRILFSNKKEHTTKLKGIILNERSQTEMLHTGGFQLYDIVDKAKLGDDNTISGCQGLRGGRGMNR